MIVICIRALLTLNGPLVPALLDVRLTHVARNCSPSVESERRRMPEIWVFEGSNEARGLIDAVHDLLESGGPTHQKEDAPSMTRIAGGNDVAFAFP